METLTLATLRCWSCEMPLDEEDSQEPYEREGHIWCDECYHEWFEFVCSWCEEWGDDEDQHRYLVVFEAEGTGVALPGFYRVEATPYYTQSLLGTGRLYPWALTWLGYLPPGQEEPEGYRVGHICAACQQRALAESAWATACGVVAVLEGQRS